MAFFYIIKEVSSSRYYAGVSASDSSDFLTENGYKTSSSKIKKIIKAKGTKSFSIIAIVNFLTFQNAFEHETKFLIGVNAKENPNFFNCHNNHIAPYNSEDFHSAMMKNYGVETPMESPELKEKLLSVMDKKHGGIGFGSTNIETQISKTMIEKYGVERVMQSKEGKENFTSRIKERYGVDWPMQSNEILAKSKATSIKKYGTEHPTQSDIVKEATKNNNLIKYGYDNPMKDPEIKKKQYENWKKAFMVTCVHCGKTTTKTWYNKQHGDKCQFDKLGETT